ncbi:MAG TPA: PilZ domain-containing protein [Gemmataceae bacterium]|nr:PilZ domain-containing protein [Gemmataceae bacterium]
MAHESVQIQPAIPEFPEQDRRVGVRYIRALKTYCQRGLGEPDQVWWIGQIRDISSSGIGLFIQHDFEPQAILTVELENSARNNSCTVQVRVVHSTPQPDGFWLVGCTFLKELSEAELEKLL